MPQINLIGNFFYSDEFVRPLLLQERIDGLDVRVQELVRDAAKKTLLSEENSSKIKIQGEMSNAGCNNFS